MQSRYREDPSIQAVFRYLYPDFYEGVKKQGPKATTNDMCNFMGFYEELAIMVNSHLMKPEVAYYTFGVDAVEFWNSETSWHNEPTWKLFRSFVEEVMRFQDRFPNGPDQIAELRY
jgi:hypothetical protein